MVVMPIQWQDVKEEPFRGLLSAYVSERRQLRSSSFRGHDKRIPAVNAGEQAKILIAQDMSIQESRTCGNSKH